MLSGFLLAAGILTACARPALRGAVYDPPIQAPDFALTDTRGVKFRLEELRGKVVLLTFGYTTCPDVCPATLAIAGRLFAGPDLQAAPVRLVFVTVDPERDTPAVIGEYLSQFSPNFVGLTGDPLELAQVLQDYGIEALPASVGLPADEALLDHTGRLYLIDTAGRLRTQYPVGTTEDDLRQDIRSILDGLAREAGRDG